jgi:hypothetical protein
VSARLYRILELFAPPARGAPVHLYPESTEPDLSLRK